jgi:hypothetical protein
MRHTTLRQAALGVIAILAVMLMLEVSISAGDRADGTRRIRGRESSLDSDTEMSVSP